MIKVNPTTTLIPITLLIGGTSLATPYMIITKKIFKQKLNKLNQIKIIRTKYQNYNNNLNKTNHKILTNTNTSKKNNYQYQNKSLNITPKTNHLNIKKKILK